MAFLLGILSASEAAVPAIGSKRLGLALIMLEDFGIDDLQLLEMPQKMALNDMFPGNAGNVRSTSPDEFPSQASLLTGKFPSEIGILNSDGLPSLTHFNSPDLNLFQTLQANGFKVGHFGQWPFKESVSDFTESHFVSDDATATATAAENFLASLGPDETFFLSVWLPRIDATFNHGGKFTESSWDAGIGGIYVKGEGSGNCPDVSRGEGNFNPQYVSCPAQIYKANRLHDSNLVLKLGSSLSSLSNSAVLTILSSWNGPESEQIDGHSTSRTSYRGIKRSLYEGGIRVPFRYGFFGMENSLELDIESSVSIVDLYPTVLAFVGINPVETDGIDISDCFFNSQCSTVRSKPLFWEWRYESPGHCMTESPRFGMLMGDFKLYLEYDEDDSVHRFEMYDLSQRHYEMPNLLAATSLALDTSSVVVDDFSTAMRVELERWIVYLRQVNPNDADSLKHYGCKSGLAVLETPVEGDLDPVSQKTITDQDLKNKIQGIIVILGDDIGAGDLSAYRTTPRKKYVNGKPVAFEPETPFLDQLMDMSTVFSAFYANAPVCSPSRASLVTGRYPFEKQVSFHNIVDKLSSLNNRRGVTDYLGKNVALDKLTTVTKFFSDQGYKTAHFGKWHIGYEIPNKFRANYDLEGKLYSLDEWQVYGVYDYHIKKNHQFPTASKKQDTTYDNTEIEFSAYIQTRLVDRTLDFVRDRVARNEKFYVNLWLQSAHAPLNLATAFDQPLENGYPESSNPFRFNESSLFNSVDRNLPLQIYRTLFRDQERQVDRLVKSLADMGIGNNTVIIYVADNGPEESSLYFATTGSSNPFRGKKRTLYEGGIRVPFFAYWPGMIQNKRIVTLPSSIKDIFPTVAGLAGLSSNLKTYGDFGNMQGRDLSCLMIGNCDNQCTSLECDQNSIGQEPIIFERRDDTVGDCLTLAPRFAVRYGNYKLLWEPSDKNDIKVDSNSGTLRLELYNVIQDPSEMNNILLLRKGDPAVIEKAAEMKQMILDMVASPKYDSVKKPQNAFNTLRPDFMFTQTFVLDDRCSFSDPSTAYSAQEVGIYENIATEALCAVDYMCPGSGKTPPIYLAIPTGEPTTISPSVSPTTQSPATSSPHTIAPSTGAPTDINHTGAPTTTSTPTITMTTSPTPSLATELTTVPTSNAMISVFPSFLFSISLLF